MQTPSRPRWWSRRREGGRPSKCKSGVGWASAARIGACNDFQIGTVYSGSPTLILKKRGLGRLTGQGCPNPFNDIHILGKKLKNGPKMV